MILVMSSASLVHRRALTLKLRGEVGSRGRGGGLGRAFFEPFCVSSTLFLLCASKAP